MAARPAATRVQAVILAAGRGSRMRSDRAKVLHEIAGLPLVTWVVRAVAPLVERTVVVVGHQGEAVRAALAEERVAFAEQPSPEGTGHALLCARDEVRDADELFVLAGDVPLVRTETLAACLSEHRRGEAAATVLTFVAADPRGYGRVVRGSSGEVLAIVEEREASAAERRLRECNSACFVLDARAALPRLASVRRRPGGEIYLTDLVAALRRDGLEVAAFTAPEPEAMGINSPEQLAEAERCAPARGGPAI